MTPGLRPPWAILLSCLLSCAHLASAKFINETSYVLDRNSETGTIRVLDPETGDEIAQTSASDGAGKGMDIPAVLWIVFAFLLGIPLLTMGVRLGRFTSGVGLGLAMAVALWTAVINAIGDADIPDLVILAITAVLFLVGFIVGVITIEYRLGTLALGATGGMSIIMRIILMRENLLVPIYFVNWVLCGVSGVVGFCLLMINERWGVIIGSSAAGSFLSCLGIDLIINKQSGMSRILRFLFDRNKYHLADVFGNDHAPLISTQVIMSVSVGLIPVFAYIQHKLFAQPFRKIRHRPGSLLGDDASIRSRTWIGKFRGRMHPRPVTPIECDEAGTTQRLVANSEEETAVQSPGPTAYRDELKEETLAAAGVPTLKLSEH